MPYRCLTLALLAATAPHLPAQTAPADLLRPAIAAEDQQKSLQARFTYFDLDHLQNRSENGKLYLDRLAFYEDTYIADLPYKRLIELNGRPLQGAGLAKEQARYDQAVAERKGLDADARAKLLNVRNVDLGIHLADVLTPAYQLTELRQQTLDGHLTHVIQAISTTPNKTFQFWITDAANGATPTLLRVTIDIDTDEPTVLHGSHIEKDFQLIDGTPVLRHTLIHSFYPNKGKTITIDTEHTYTRYRRFSATARILPNEDSSTPPPQ